MDGGYRLSDESVSVIQACAGIMALTVLNTRRKAKKGEKEKSKRGGMSAGGVAAMETGAAGESVRYVKVRAVSRRGTLQRPSLEYGTDPGHLQEGAYGVPDSKDSAVQAAWKESGTYANFSWGQLNMYGDGFETGVPFDAEVEATMYAEHKQKRKSIREKIKVEAAANDAVAKLEIKEEEAADCDSDSDKSGGNGGENDDAGAKSEVAGRKRDGIAGKSRGPPIGLRADQTLPKGFGPGYIDKAPHGCEFTVDAHASQESALHSLFRIFGKTLFKDIAVNTSKNQARWAALDKDRVARPVSFDEIIHWFGLVVAMGLQKVAPSRKYCQLVFSRAASSQCRISAQSCPATVLKKSNDFCVMWTRRHCPRPFCTPMGRAKSEASFSTCKPPCNASPNPRLPLLSTSPCGPRM
jgi:hypothetical protein